MKQEAFRMEFTFIVLFLPIMEHITEQPKSAVWWNSPQSSPCSGAGAESQRPLMATFQARPRLSDPHVLARFILTVQKGKCCPILKVEGKKPGPALAVSNYRAERTL